MKLRLWHVILHENGQCLLGTKKLEIMPNVGVEIFLSLPITFPVIVNVNPCQIQTDNTQISIFDFFQPNLVHYQYYKNAPVACSFEDGAMSFVGWKSRIEFRAPFYHLTQLSPKLSSISTRLLLCCFHQWLSVSYHNDMLSSTSGGTSKVFFKSPFWIWLLALA